MTEWKIDQGPFDHRKWKWLKINKQTTNKWTHKMHTPPREGHKDWTQRSQQERRFSKEVLERERKTGGWISITIQMPMKTLVWGRVKKRSLFTKLLAWPYDTELCVLNFLCTECCLQLGIVLQDSIACKKNKKYTIHKRILSEVKMQMWLKFELVD